jgi:hypothetical protein
LSLGTGGYRGFTMRRPRSAATTRLGPTAIFATVRCARMRLNERARLRAGRRWRSTSGVAALRPRDHELIRQHAQAMYQQGVVLKLMPLANTTQITDDERALIKRWFEAGAKAD